MAASEQVGVIGLGRFGAFWAARLSQDFSVLATDIDASKADQTELEQVTFTDLKTLCESCSTLFICTPISLLHPLLTEIKEWVRPGTTLIDTCSVKSEPARHMQTVFADGEVELIASHPMLGPDSGKESWKDLPIAVWPLNPEHSRRYAQWNSWFVAQGLKLLEISPDEHDRMAAYGQGVTHFIGRVLDELNLQATPLDSRGTKILRMLTEQTSNDSWELFQDLQVRNPYTRDMRLELENALNKVYDRLIPDQVSGQAVQIGIQGGKGSFNDEACRQYCRRYPAELANVDIHYLYTAENVLRALHAGEIDRGVFAIQNARGGAVMETIQGLSEFTCHIFDVFDLVISHCLLHHPGTDFADVHTIISHPQALAQCSRTLVERFPHLKKISGEGDLIDQAFCADQIMSGNLDPQIAVLAPKVCAELYGLSVQATDLQDLGDANLTTFVWVGRRDTFK
jgi:prephenate dehydrogenase/prephenate dehydratase